MYRATKNVVRGVKELSMRRKRKRKDPRKDLKLFLQQCCSQHGWPIGKTKTCPAYSQKEGQNLDGWKSGWRRSMRSILDLRRHIGTLPLFNAQKGY